MPVRSRKSLFLLLGLVCLAPVQLLVYHCPLRAITGIPCPGCGMTTALKQLLSGEVQASFHTHPMLVPTLVMAAAAAAALAFRKEKLAARLAMVWGIAMLGVYVWRMAVWFPQAPMAALPDGLLVKLFHLAG